MSETDLIWNSVDVACRKGGVRVQSNASNNEEVVIKASTGWAYMSIEQADELIEALIDVTDACKARRKRQKDNGGFKCAYDGEAARVFAHNSGTYPSIQVIQDDDSSWVYLTPENLIGLRNRLTQILNERDWETHE